MLAPESVYANVYAALPRLIELIVTVDARPTHCEVAVGAVNMLTLGALFTVTCAVILQPEESVYVIVGVPAATPVTVPVVDPIVASAVLLLVHVPPVVASLNVSVAPGQIAPAPVIDAGVPFTEKDCVTLQPVGKA
jgi:hypothetical protein